MIIECVCGNETARLRLERDAAAGGHPAANRSYDLYLTIQARFEPIRKPKLVIDTDQPLSENVVLCVAFVRAEQLNPA